MDANTEAIVRLCFARHLGLADDALETDGRVEVTDESRLACLQLWGTTVVSAPALLQPGLADLAPAELADPSVLLRLTGRGRLLGAARLSLLDELDRHPDLERLEVDPEPGAAADLERRCPPDDVTQVGLSGRETTFVHHDESGQSVAGAGYSVWAGLVADVGVLTEPGSRGRGLARVLTGIAVNHALDAGLVPVWRAPVGSTASARLAAAIGFLPFGSELAIDLTAG